MGSLSGRRVLVAGASSGIGRATALAAREAGARVAAAARRQELLEALGGDIAAVRCDVRDPASCEGAVARAAEALGGLDALVYAAGMAPLARLAGAGAEEWREALATNVVGAALVTRACLPHLIESRGRAAYLSSPAAQRPWPALVLYAVSKSALDTLVQGLRTEVPEVAFTRVVVGPTVTEFAAAWDRDLAAEMLAFWRERGYMSGAVMTPEQVAAEVVRVLASPVRIEDVLVNPL